MSRLSISFLSSLQAFTCIAGCIVVGDLHGWQEEIRFDEEKRCQELGEVLFTGARFTVTRSKGGGVERERWLRGQQEENQWMQACDAGALEVQSHSLLVDQCLQPLGLERITRTNAKDSSM